MTRVIWTLPLLLMMFVPPAYAQSEARDARAERPIQLQVDFPGLHAGYHFNPTWYLGITHQFGYDGDGYGGNNPPDERPVYGQQGSTHTDTDVGARTALELRISPWEFGFYFALGILDVQPIEQSVRWDERGRRVGDGDYITGLEAQIESKPVTTPALGLGFNHVFEMGLSVGAGILLGVMQPDDPDVTVTATNPAVTDEDLARFRKRIQERFPDIPFMFHLAVGYNF